MEVYVCLAESFLNIFNVKLVYFGSFYVVMFPESWALKYIIKLIIYSFDAFLPQLNRCDVQLSIQQCIYIIKLSPANSQNHTPAKNHESS